MLVDTINEYKFSDEMIKHGFSYEGSKALFEYFTRNLRSTFPLIPSRSAAILPSTKTSKRCKRIIRILKRLISWDNTIVLEVPDTKKLVIMGY
jgi:hypothetical protein